MTKPFLTLYTPTFRRPRQLAACLASVQAQTAVSEIEQIVIPDHIGIGVEGMYATVPKYGEAVHGEYVHLFCDDDVLAAPDVVERVKSFAREHDSPPAIIVKSEKAGSVWPAKMEGPPVCGAIDLGCVITRADIWTHLVLCGAYKPIYEGDFTFASALWEIAGPRWHYFDLLFCRGAVSRGAAEAA